MKSEYQPGKNKILNRLPRWIKLFREICIEFVKEQAPEEYEKLKKAGRL